MEQLSAKKNVNNNPRKSSNRNNHGTVNLVLGQNKDLMKIPIVIGGISISALVDSGAITSIISTKVFATLEDAEVKEVRKNITALSSATGDKLKIVGRYKIPLLIQGKDLIEHEFYVITNIGFDCILGIDFIRERDIIINGKEGKFTYTTANEVHSIIAAVAASIDEKTGVEPNISHLMGKQKQLMKELLYRNQDIFAINMMELGCTDIVEHAINNNDIVTYVRPYKTPMTQRPIIKQFIDEMLENRIIRPSVSPYSSPIVLTKKASGELRFCIDFRVINGNTPADRYQLPRIMEVFNSLYGTTIYSVFDMFSGFWQLNLREKDRHKTSFSTEFGSFEFNRFPFGLKNSGSVFQRMINRVMGPALGKHVICYMDDGIVFSRSFQEHLVHIEDVFQRLREFNLRLKLAKCAFAKDKLLYVGHIVNEAGIKPNPEKIEAVKNYPVPTNIKQLRTTLGLFNYYRTFVKGYAKTAEPLTNLTKKGVKWNWTKEHQEAFETLKENLIKAPILAYANINDDYIIDCDASDYAIGSVLVQRQKVKVPLNEDDNTWTSEDQFRWETKEVAIAYSSRKLSDRERKYACIDREGLCIFHAFKAFYEYVYGRHVTVRTDHAPLQYIMKKRDPSGRIGRWILYLQKFDLTIIYRPGNKNQNADALSRIPFETGINTIQTKGIPKRREWIEKQRTDHYCETLLEPLRRKDTARLTRSGGILRINNKIVVPQDLKTPVMERFHEHQLSCHLGVDKSLAKIKEQYYWPGMRKDIQKFIKSCTECAQYKGGRVEAIPLKPIEATRFPWERVGLDVKGPLPETYRGNRYCLVMCDHLTRYVEVTAMKDQKAATIAAKFIKRIILRYGAGLQILTDQGTPFMSKLMKNICKRLEIQQIRTSAYSPSTNGAVERWNKTLGEMLRTSIRDQSDWDSLLPYIQFAYNSAVQSSLGETPHFLNYTRDPIMPDSFEEEPERNSSIDTADELFFSKWQKALESAREALITAQGKQKKYYDKNKKTKKIKAGDRILLRNMRLSNKLDRKWLGPYIVTRTLGTTNCAIQLEQGSKVEMVVHLNRIKLFPNRENLAENENFEISEPDDSNTISETESEEELPSHNRKTKKNRKPNLPHKNRKTKKKNSDTSEFEDSSTQTETESEEEQTPNERKRNHNRKTHHPNQNTLRT